MVNKVMHVPLLILRCATSSCAMELAVVQRVVIAITPTPSCAEPPWLQETVCEEIVTTIINQESTDPS